MKYHIKMELDFNNIINKRVRYEVLAILGIRNMTNFKSFDPGKVLLEHVEIIIIIMLKMLCI